MKSLAFYCSTSTRRWLAFCPLRKPDGAQTGLARRARVVGLDTDPGDPHEALAVEEKRHAAALPRRNGVLLKEVFQRARRATRVRSQAIAPDPGAKAPSGPARSGEREPLAFGRLEAHRAASRAELDFALPVPRPLPAPVVGREALDANAIAELHQREPGVLDAHARIAARIEELLRHLGEARYGRHRRVVQRKERAQEVRAPIARQAGIGGEVGSGHFRKAVGARERIEQRVGRSRVARETGRGFTPARKALVEPRRDLVAQVIAVVTQELVGLVVDPAKAARFNIGTQL